MDTAILWSAVTLALLLLGVAPSLFLVARGSDVQRLVGLQLLTGSSIMVLIGLSIIVGQSSYLIVPLVLAVLASIGTLVYTRLLKPGIDAQAVRDEE
ncbi:MULTISPECIES: monovalent cation/H+ antiporter complex subunit F [unclassified Arthrobacter]|uniref:monovalent cation/H+ antiporter complex subunit F n=1 Tax=unclassified Arthrobacter TaxID=235627 RepID=UPI002226BBDC|nr:MULTISPECIES: monovalent cation/H+ antiporter complex subunit F [unclassified Arthrobacter]UYY79721.1 monovalent cation/H+ antiporter complex subunit F [Arthrobacter sp. YA7-1]